MPALASGREERQFGGELSQKYLLQRNIEQNSINLCAFDHMQKFTDRHNFGHESLKICAFIGRLCTATELLHRTKAFDIDCGR
jgi:hypothetical protein